MDNNQPFAPMEDDHDVFSSRGSTTRASSTRIHFPVNNNMGLNRPTRPRPDNQHLLSGIDGQRALSGMTPPGRRGSPLNPSNMAIDPRRQPWPPDTSNNSFVDSSARHRRNPSFGQANHARSDLQASLSGQEGPLEAGVFSDEYDLAHEDPRILQDVQRALEMKARREARMKRETMLTPEKVLSSGYTTADLPDTRVKDTGSTPSLPKASIAPTVSSPNHGSNRKASTSTASDVDFSPATRAFDASAQPHPIPCSNDNGRTFDWSSAYADEGDKRWPISLGKRKEKDKLPPLGALMDEQEELHRVKLADLARTASPQSIRKADLVSRQLNRRYTLIYSAIGPTTKALNLASISRWHANQSENVKNSLEKAEPFTWLKHLEKRRSRATRSRWNLSALIMEQYVSRRGHERMQTIPENSPMLDSVPSFPRKSRSPSFLSSSIGTNGHEEGQFTSTDDRVSFEPLGEFKRNSLDAMPRQSGESPLSSISSKGGISPLSPISTRSDNKESRIYVSPQRPRSPGSSSSASTSSSLFSKATEGQTPALPTLVVPDLSIHPPSSEQLVDSVVLPLTLAVSNGSSSSSRNKHLSSANIQSVASLKDNSKPRSQVRLSSPPPDRSGNRKKKRYRAKIEEQLQQEYETKASILQEVSAHNHRVRQLLNRISSGLRDYDSLQQVSASSPGVNQRNVPRDVLETFSHDPSAVTGSTRRLRGWRAVEDIHQRVHRQRAILRAFIDASVEYHDKPGCILDEPIENVLRALGQVEIHNDEIVHGNKEVAGVLSSVEEQYREVKAVYDKTASRVSVLYPELSTIVALEESYRDQYQQVWDFGLDALTLLLDTVTPVWRTYGKAIGEDVRDFLIIPLYRNEFTGEAKTYPIKEFPRRSLRHWFGLVFFLILSVAVNILQARAAITSSMNCRLQSIPYDGLRWTALPFFWIAIIIQWFAVTFELVVVFMQLGVILWWTGWSVRLLN